MTADYIKGMLSEENPEAMLLDGWDDALIGVVHRASMKAVALYDEGKIIETLKSRDGMSDEEAQEYFDFNIVGAYVGEGTPCFARIPS